MSLTDVSSRMSNTFGILHALSQCNAPTSLTIPLPPTATLQGGSIHLTALQLSFIPQKSASNLLQISDLRSMSISDDALVANPKLENVVNGVTGSANVSAKDVHSGLEMKMVQQSKGVVIDSHVHMKTADILIVEEQGLGSGFIHVGNTQRIAHQRVRAVD